MQVRFLLGVPPISTENPYATSVFGVFFFSKLVQGDTHFCRYYFVFRITVSYDRITTILKWLAKLSLQKKWKLQRFWPNLQRFHFLLEEFCKTVVSDWFLLSLFAGEERFFPAFVQIVNGRVWRTPRFLRHFVHIPWNVDVLQLGALVESGGRNVTRLAHGPSSIAAGDVEP